MLKYSLFAVSGCLMSLGLFAQSDVVLQSIENNNVELKAYHAQLERERLNLKISNNLPDPEVSGYYLPFTDNSVDYVELEVSQAMEFPTVYGKRKEWINLQSDQLELSYKVKRQAILLKAKLLSIEIAKLNKSITIEEDRVAKAKQVYEQVKLQFDEGKISILELNKDKVAWMQVRFKVDQLRLNQKNLMLQLTQMNGGEALVFDEVLAFKNDGLMSLDSLWEEKKLQDPVLHMQHGKEQIALQEMKVVKAATLPNLKGGYNYQNMGGAINAGIYAGISIPLWSNKGRLEASEANYQFQKMTITSSDLDLYQAFEKKYNEYGLMLRKYEEYKSTLSALNSDDLLQQAYELGAISFVEFYMELQFYRDAYDDMLEMEKELSMLKAVLLSYKL